MQASTREIFEQYSFCYTGKGEPEKKIVRTKREYARIIYEREREIEGG